MCSEKSGSTKLSALLSPPPPRPPHTHTPVQEFSGVGGVALISVFRGLIILFSDENLLDLSGIYVVSIGLFDWAFWVQNNSAVRLILLASTNNHCCLGCGRWSSAVNQISESDNSNQISKYIPFPGPWSVNSHHLYLVTIVCKPQQKDQCVSLQSPPPPPAGLQ